MTLPIFEPGSTVIAEERWHHLLWSAVPQRVLLSSSSELISYLPTGTAATFATNRGLPEAEGLDREQRKLLAMKTCRGVVAQRSETPDKLFIYRPGAAGVGRTATTSITPWQTTSWIPASGLRSRPRRSSS